MSDERFAQARALAPLATDIVMSKAMWERLGKPETLDGKPVLLPGSALWEAAMEPGDQPLTLDLLRQAIDATEDPTEIELSPRGARIMAAWLEENPEYIVA